MPVPAPPAVLPWRTVMRERPLAVPRAAAWAGLRELLGSDPGDISVEPPWRHVRSRSVAGGERCELTITLRDDGDRSHVAWCAGTTAEGPPADALLAELAAEGEQLLERLDEVTGG